MSAEAAHDFATIRRLEAVGFRSFPSTTTHYDGTWAMRLTAGHPAKRLNSVNPLDPNDTDDLERRVELAKQRFAGFGRPLVFRQTPLAPAALDRLLDERNWSRFDESLVMLAPLQAERYRAALDHVPLKDTGRWVDACLALGGEPAERKPGMVEVLGAIRAETGLFLEESPDGFPVAAVRCVHDNDLAGIFELVTALAARRKGHGETLLGQALKWACGRGARHAWLQVEAANIAAIRLYGKFGFREMYRYVYRGQPQ